MRAAAIGAALLVLAACTPSPDEAADQPPKPDWLQGDPASELVAGEELWRLETGLPVENGSRIQVRDQWFLAASVVDGGASAPVVLGELATGQVLLQSELETGVGWPTLVRRGGDPAVLTVQARPDDPRGDEVVLLDAAGEPLWRTSGAAIGQEPGTTLNPYTAVDDDTIMLFAVDRDRGPYNVADLVVLDPADGSRRWGTDPGTPVGLPVVQEGVVLAGFRADGSTLVPPDRVRAWDAATGEVLFTHSITDVSGIETTCGGAVSAQRILVCGVGNPGPGTMRILDRSGEQIAEADIAERPAIDPDADTVAYVDQSGGVAVLDAGDGGVVWSRDSQPDAQQLEVNYVRDGLLVGSLGPDNVVLDSSDGSLLATGNLVRLPESQRSRDAAAVLVEGMAVGVSGPAAPIAVDRLDRSVVVYVRP